MRTEVRTTTLTLRFPNVNSMKTSVKIAVIGAIATVLAAVIPVVISRVINQNDKNGNSEKPIVTPYHENHPAGDVSIKNTANVIVGDITTGECDVIIGGTKTTTIQALSESQNNETKQKNEHIYSEQHK